MRIKRIMLMRSLATVCGMIANNRGSKMVRSCDVVITLLLEDVFDLCIGAAYVLDAVMLNGGVGSGVRNCRESVVSLCMFADCHTY